MKRSFEQENTAQESIVPNKMMRTETKAANDSPSSQKQSSNIQLIKVIPPVKQIDKSQKQQFKLEFAMTLSTGEPILHLTNTNWNLKTNKNFWGPSAQGSTFSPLTNSDEFLLCDGELSIQVFSNGRDVTFNKCSKCQHKDASLFATPISAFQKTCFALIESRTVQFEKGLLKKKNKLGISFEYVLKLCF